MTRSGNGVPHQTVERVAFVISGTYLSIKAVVYQMAVVNNRKSANLPVLCWSTVKKLPGDKPRSQNHAVLGCCLYGRRHDAGSAEAASTNCRELPEEHTLLAPPARQVVTEEQLAAIQSGKNCRSYQTSLKAVNGRVETVGERRYESPAGQSTTYDRRWGIHFPTLGDIPNRQRNLSGQAETSLRAWRQCGAGVSKAWSPHPSATLRSWMVRQENSADPNDSKAGGRADGPDR